MPRVNQPHEDFDEQAMFSPSALPMPPKKASKMAHLNPQLPSGGVLSKYYRYRVPGPHIKLATRGVFFPPNAIEMTLAGDIPVFPMVSADEMLLKSPDALMSGLALEKLFESCVPAIKTPRLISAPDIDVLLLAIRVATYGNKMALAANCPACKHENSFDCDLPSLLATMVFMMK
jgi:hypothetical protein